MLKKTVQVAGSLVVAIGLASCGGGGDIAGDSTEFFVTPDETNITVVSDTGSCASAAGATPVVFTIIGGQPPFRIVNSSPGGLIVDKTEATGKDPKFTARPTGACGDAFLITVLDYHSRTASVEFSVEFEKPDEEVTTPTTP